MLFVDRAVSPTETELISVLKWAVPLVISSIALCKSIWDSRSARTENSTRTRQQYNAELRRWTTDCITTLSEVIGLCEQSEFDLRRMSELNSRLSAHADNGRLFFPNPQPDAYGQEKPASSRGYRPRILDWLVYSNGVCRSVKSTPDSEALDLLKALKKGFTSDAQLVIDPRHLLTTMEDLRTLLQTGEFMEVSQSATGLVAAKELIVRRK